MYGFDDSYCHLLACFFPKRKNQTYIRINSWSKVFQCLRVPYCFFMWSRVVPSIQQNIGFRFCWFPATVTKGLLPRCTDVLSIKVCRREYSNHTHHFTVWSLHCNNLIRTLLWLLINESKRIHPRQKFVWRCMKTSYGTIVFHGIKPCTIINVHLQRELHIKVSPYIFWYNVLPLKILIIAIVKQLFVSNTSL